MFKRITIELNGPICNCSAQNLAWQPSKDQKDTDTLHIWCKDCLTSLVVGHDQFVASFLLDNPYPTGHVSTKGDGNKKEAKIIKLVPSNPDEMKNWKAPS